MSCIIEAQKKMLRMTRGESVKAFFFKSVLPVAALLLYCFFKFVCMKNGEMDNV